MLKPLSNIKMLCVVLLSTFGSIVATAQNTISGTVIDSHTQEPLIGASVLVDGTSKGATANFDGEYIIKNLADGTYTLKVSYISYETAIQTVTLSAGENSIVNFELQPADISLKEVEVVAKANRESENILLLDRKNALISIETVGAQQMSAQGIGDAAGAAKRMAGVTHQEGEQTLNVRGLGDRYNSTTLNGLPLPSNHAEYKNIDLSLFPSDAIGYLGVEKNFTSQTYSDVAGANINIVSKTQVGKEGLKLKVGTGYNLNLLNTNKFYLQDGPTYFGFNNFSMLTDLTKYDFTNSWNPIQKTAVPDTDFSLSSGKEWKVGNGKLSTFATIGFNNDYAYTTTIQRRVNGSNDNRKDLKGEEFEYNTRTMGLLNIGYNINNVNIDYNTFFLNSSNQTLQNLRGYVIDIVGDINTEEALLRRSDFERNVVIVNQLNGNVKLKNRYNFGWKLGYNHIDNLLPDRRNNIFIHHLSSDIYTPSTNDAANNHRYFHNLDEDEYAATLLFSKKIGKAFDERERERGKITTGYSLKYKTREFEAYQYNHELDKSNPGIILPGNVDKYFNQANLDNNTFSLRTFFGTNNAPSAYNGMQMIHAGFLNIEYALTPKLSGMFGIRVENYYQYVGYQTSISSGEQDFDKIKPFPSLSLKYGVNSKNNIRFASSMTYTMPQFKETAPFLFEGITEATQGNPYLHPSTIYNGELKYEFFPTTGELISVAAFGKYIEDPINRFVMASASNDFSYANSGNWAYVYGAELDVKKHLINNTTNKGNQKLTLGVNLSIMKTEQELNKQKVKDDSDNSIIASFDKEREVLEGAAPILGNANLTYFQRWNKKHISLSAVYGYVSEKLYLIGFSSLGNQYEQAVSDLQISLKAGSGNWEASLVGKNLLNPNFTRIQRNGEVNHIVLQYQKGVKINIGITYKF